ncbi:MAG TPA: tryptophan halogenase family protein [Steroidobacter sp.]|uniref:tryptophan halogenase family protein n=1 Tax=Steroidobacter sp. TaxID=1978227 RepID=UPI002ED87137
MIKRVLIVGGGTAGWITAGYLASTLGAQARDGVRITLVESADIGILGVGEGTFPTIRKTLKRIGVDEAALLRQCGATMKQGAKFAHWRYAPGQGRPDHYLHSFQVTHQPTGLDLLPYWLLGVAGDNVNWDEVNTPQKRVADECRAPKLITHENYAAPLNYAYHFDAVSLAKFLRELVISRGVRHIVDTVDAVNLAEDGSIQSVTTREYGALEADLFIDCTGFRAQLIGGALNVPYKSCRSVLFCDSALAMQVPYEQSRSPIASYTISTAHEAGWTWDIGLEARRGIGYVFSSDHTDSTRAEETLRKYVGKAGDALPARLIKFNAGYREINWKKNCVAIGLSSGFFEPLEATGIIFTEIAAVMLSNLFPWGGNFETAARQYNEIMRRRYERALDFIKLHYCLTERRDTQFWRDNVAASSIPDSLHELLERWRFRPPDAIDIDLNVDIFTEASWQYVLYGMGYKTDLRPRAGVLKYYDEARAAFEEIKRQGEYASRTLPTNRELIEAVRTRSFGPAATGG